MDVSLGTVFLSEAFGTGMLTLLGGGVVANVLLAKSKGLGGGTLMINFGWGLAVFAGVIVAFNSGAHLNPAVTLGILTSGAENYAPHVPVSVGATFTYFGGQLIGAIIGSIFMYLAYKKHFDATEDKGVKLGVFSTGPEIRSYTWNLITEIIATFVLVIVILGFNHQGETGGLAAVGALPVAFLVVGIGASLGGPTGYAINPARDLGPRIAHAILPIKGKGSSDWGYAWVPVVGPIIGGVLAGVLSPVLLPVIGA
ncbi:MIP/aquaporin family protein [Mycetocola saprophilus]|uniref:MIP/aquaporin family protein n=1 Tax=Mycetocola saprophilus TaxID=76636 RepID=UPI003BF21DD5